jgi:hypothetical protein
MPHDEQLVKAGQTEQILKTISDDIRVMKEVLLGNGNVEKSVVNRLTRLEDSVVNCQKVSKEWKVDHNKDHEMYETELREDNRSRAGNIIAVVCTVISCTCAIVMGIITLLKT